MYNRQAEGSKLQLMTRLKSESELDDKRDHRKSPKRGEDASDNEALVASAQEFSMNQHKESKKSGGKSPEKRDKDVTVPVHGS